MFVLSEYIKTFGEWSIKDNFAKLSIQAIPTPFDRTQILYCTRYEYTNADGIYTYNTENNTHKTIKSWHDMKYYPKANGIIYSQITNTIFFAGGKHHDHDFKEIISYNITNDVITKIDLQFKIGPNPKLILTNKDSFLHIIGGQYNNKHILFNTSTNEITFIDSYAFAEIQPHVTEHALLYNQTTNKLIMLGGCSWEKNSNQTWNKSHCDSVWMFSLNHVEIIAAAYVHDTFLKGHSDAVYDVSINHIIGMYLSNNIFYGEWKMYVKYALPNSLHAFGCVLYDDRIIIVFGGQKNVASSTSDVLYLDLNAKYGWQKCKCKVPQVGRCHALLMNKTVHIFPYQKHKRYYTIDIHDVLPSSCF